MFIKNLFVLSMPQNYYSFKENLLHKQMKKGNQVINIVVLRA